MLALLGINKALLRAEDYHANQVKAILNDILQHHQNKFNPEEQLQKFKEFNYRNNTSVHSPEELDKILGNTKSEELEKRMAIITSEDFEPYKWQDITENSYANQIKKQFDRFGARYKV